MPGVIDKATLVNRFGRAVEGSSAAVFVGAGVSQEAGFPNWNDLLKFARRRLRLPASFTDLALLAQYFVSAVPGGRDVLHAEISRQLQIHAEPTQAHILLAQLPLDEYWTTNYDTLLENAIPEAHAFTEDAALAELERPFRRRVYKLHGSLPPPSSGRNGLAPQGRTETIIITREDFETYPVTHPRMWAQLTASFLTKSILFLGLSFNDPNLLHLLELARRQLGSLAVRQHFTVLRRPSNAADRRMHDLRVADLVSIGIHVCEVESFAELPEILAALVRRTRGAFVFASGSLAEGASTTMLKTIGSLAADTQLSFITAGRVGRTICYSLASSLIASHAYNPQRTILYFQAELDRASEIESRLGTVVYYGESREHMRDVVLSQVRAVLVAGGQAGTEDEVARASARGIPVIPLANTGGVALQIWTSMRRSLPDYAYGGRAIRTQDFDLLNHNDEMVVARHALKLLLQAVYLD